ncbi:MAG: proton-conducting transporter membrane subunit [Verrucomicrobiales bacterium]
MDYLPHAILLLPLAAAAAIFLGVRRSPSASALLATASALVTLVLAFLMKGQADATATLLEWIPAGDITLDIGFKIDAHSKGMMIVVTLVGSLVHLFSLGYMKDDPGKARYFAGLALFMFSMTGIVLADNFAMMFVFWELVGVSSYLLIGHWFQKNSAAEAAKKAFLVNRIGDFGFMAGILLLWGVVGSVNFDDLEKSPPALAEPHAGLLTAAALCASSAAR